MCYRVMKGYKILVVTCPSIFTSETVVTANTSISLRAVHKVCSFTSYKKSGRCQPKICLLYPPYPLSYLRDFGSALYCFSDSAHTQPLLRRGKHTVPEVFVNRYARSIPVSKLSITSVSRYSTRPFRYVTSLHQNFSVVELRLCSQRITCSPY